MTVTCPDCRSVFRVDPAKVPATGVRARCSVCGGVIAIAGGTLPVSVTPASLGALPATPLARSAVSATARPYTPATSVPAATESVPPIMTPPVPSRVPPLPFRRPTPPDQPVPECGPEPTRPSSRACIGLRSCGVSSAEARGRAARRDVAAVISR